MNKVLFSILLVVIGLIVGFCISLIVNFLKGSNASKKAEKLISQAKKILRNLKEKLL